MFLINVYKRLVIVLATFLPLLGVGVFSLTSNPAEKFHYYSFHEVAISVAIILSIFVSYVAYRSYEKNLNPFFYFIALAYLGFAIVYAPHGVFTRMADHNMPLFLIFGPVSRFTMSAYLLIGLLKFNPVLNMADKKNSRRFLWGHILFLFGVLVFLFVIASTVKLNVIHIKSIESASLALSCASLLRMMFLPVRSLLMRFHLVAQLLFAQASIAFLLSLPWNSLWWFAHAISAAGFITLGYAIVHCYEMTRSFDAVYDELVLHSILDNIIENSPVGILLVDSSFGRIRSNKAIRVMLGAQDGMLNTKDLLSRLEIDSKDLQNSLGSLPVLVKTFKIDVANGLRFYEARISMVRPYETSEAFLFILIDRTEAHLAEEERGNFICELQDALAKVKTLSGLLPICSSCKNVRDDKGYWNQIEVYIRDHSEAEFSHGLCPSCTERLYPEFAAQLRIEA
jgi:PAS domain-containing protein